MRLRYLLLPWIVALAPAAASGQDTTPILENLTVPQLTSLLGSPAESESAGSSLRWETPIGAVRFYVVDGKTTAFTPAPPLQTGIVGPKRSTKDLRRVAKDKFKAGDKWAALAFLDECFRVSALNDGSCLNDLKLLSTDYSRTLLPHLSAATESELLEAQAFLATVSRLNPLAAADRDRVRNEYLRLIEPRVAILLKAQSDLQVADATRRAEDALGRSNYRDALDAVEAYATNPKVAPIRSRIRVAAADDASRLVAAFEASNDYTQFRALLDQLSVLIPIIDPQTLTSLQERWLKALANSVRAKANVDTSSLGAAGLVQRLLIRDLRLSDAEADTFPWTRLLGRDPRLSVRLNIARDAACGGSPGLSDESVMEALARTVPTASFSTTAGTFPLNIGIHCASAIEKGERSEMPSVYVVAKQQIGNPEYVQIQTQLEAAQVHLAEVRLKWALNPPMNGWAGLAKGLEEGTAVGRVNSLLSQLQDTPPFLERPVDAPYTFTSTELTKTVVVDLDIESVNDTTKKVYAAEMRFARDAKSKEVTGVMASDRRGNYDTQPSFPADAEMQTAAFAGATADQLDGVRRVLREGLVGRIDAMGPGGDPMELLGTLAIAQSFAKASENVPPEYSEMLKAINAATLQTVRTIKVAFPKAPAPKAVAPKLTTAAKTVPSRTDMLKVAMQSIVSIETEAKSGSGFFVSSSGDIVTNAHVIEGANRIRVKTASTDVYLATVVRSDPAIDLALLRISGYSGPFLTLTMTDDAAVGTDVIAVGNPLGLEGTVTRGIISAKRTIDGVPYLQIDAAINPGNSGGPLLAEDGTVLGVNTWKVRSSTAESIGFAVSSGTVRKVLGQYFR